MTKPKIDPERWQLARQQWEGSLEVSLTDIAAQLGVAVPTVSIRAKKELWIKVDEVDLKRVNYSPRELTEIALQALVRAATQTKDMASAVKAAGMILERTMGRVVATQELPMLPPDLVADEGGQPQAPEWLSARRLLYQEAIAQGRDPMRDPAEPPPQLQEPRTDPEPQNPACPEPERAVEAPQRLHVVPRPQFWDSPTKPAA